MYEYVIYFNPPFNSWLEMVVPLCNLLVGWVLNNRHCLYPNETPPLISIRVFIPTG